MTTDIVSPITLTDKALSRLKHFAKEESLAPIVRVKVIGGGCAGFSNDMCFEDTILDDDEVFMFDDMRIIIDPLSLMYLDGTIIDYVESLYGSAFKFLNQNHKSCGCGSSYTPL